MNRNPRRIASQLYGPPGDAKTQLLNMILMGDIPMGHNHQDPYNDNPNIPPATVEDDPNSYWDARHMGNGRGQSIINGPDGQTYRADPVGIDPVNDVLMQLLATMGVK